MLQSVVFAAFLHRQTSSFAAAAAAAAAGRVVRARGAPPATPNKSENSFHSSMTTDMNNCHYVLAVSDILAVKLSQK